MRGILTPGRAAELIKALLGGVNEALERPVVPLTLEGRSYIKS